MKRIIMKRWMGLIIALAAVALLSSCALPAKKGRSQAAPAILFNQGVTNFVLTAMERELAKKLNDLRVNPREWAAYLRSLKKSEEVEEAAVFLDRKKPLPPLAVSRGLCLAAGELLTDHGPKGLTGHKGSTGSASFERMNKYGQWDGKAGENLYYGYGDADRLMIGLLTEGGSQGWEQRNNVLSPDFKVMGIACGKHYVYRTMCVIDFATAYTEIP